MSYYVYILQSVQDKKYYIGSTADVKARLAYHNSGHQRSTRSRKPFKLVHVEEHVNKAMAIKREKEIKSYKGGQAFKQLINLIGSGRP